MTKFIDVGVRDLMGASKQWRDYIAGTLGYDHDVNVQIGIENGKPQVWIRGEDAFQQRERSSIWDQIGQLRMLEDFSPDAEWDAVCGAVWEKLQKCMKRDERELRFSMEAMGGLIEKAPSLTSAVGKMIAERIKAARDEATAHMIEHHGWQAAE